MPWSLINLAVTFVVFGLLARLAPCNPGQPKFITREFADNSLYWFLGWFLAVVLYADLPGLMMRVGAGLAFGGHGAAFAARAATQGWGWMSHLPIVVQAIVVVLLIDIIQYWLHRAFHGRDLWPFHAIHHSAEQVDWTTGYRFHPVNYLVYAAGVYALVQCLGFSPMAFAIIGPFNLVVGALVHANLNWTFGPFRYVVASPVFHRWHHVRDPAIRNKNFAPTFPVLDLMFDTFYMPKGELPADYGAEDVPPHFLGQLIYPFAVYAERLGLKARPATA